MMDPFVYTATPMTSKFPQTYIVHVLARHNACSFIPGSPSGKNAGPLHPIIKWVIAMGIRETYFKHR